MKQQLYKDAFSEVVFLINNMSIENREKISKKFIEFLEENKNQKYIPEDISLDKPDLLKRETRIVLSLIYRDYFCEKEKLEKVKEKEDITSKIKSYEEIFDNQDEKKIEKEIKEEIELLDISQITWYEKFVTKLKNIINKIFKK